MKKSNNLKDIAKGAGIVITGIGIMTVINYINKVILAKWLGPEQFGLFSLAFGILSAVTLIGMAGIPNAVRRYISFFRGKENKDEIKSIIRAGTALGSFISITLGIIFFFLAGHIATFFGNESLRVYLQLFAICIPALIILRITQATLEGFKNMKASVMLDASVSLIRLIIGGSLVIIGFGVLGATLGYIVATVCISLIGVYILLKKGKCGETKKKNTSYKKILTFSLPLMFAGVVGPLLSWSDTIILGYFGTLENVGVYNVALPTAALLRNALAGFTAIFLAIATELYARKKFKQIRKDYQTTTRWVISLTTGVTAVIICFASEILSMFFSSEYAQGGTILIILTIGFFIEVAFGPVVQVLVAAAKTKIIMVNRLSMAVTNILLDLMLIPKWGIIGAAIATAISLGGLNILMAYQAFKEVKVQPFTGKYLRVILAGIIAILATKAVISTGGNFIQTIGGMTFTTGVYIGAFVLLRCFGKEDKELYKVCKKKISKRL